MNKKAIGFISFIIFFANIFFLSLILNAEEKADKDKTITRRFSMTVRMGLATKTGRALDLGFGSQLALNFLTPSRLSLPFFLMSRQIEDLKDSQLQSPCFTILYWGEIL